MTRLSIFKNRRLLTILFLFITFVFAGLAIFLAITLNNRSVNPDDTSANAKCDSVKFDTYSSCVANCSERGGACEQACVDKADDAYRKCIDESNQQDYPVSCGRKSTTESCTTSSGQPGVKSYAVKCKTDACNTSAAGECITDQGDATCVPAGATSGDQLVRCNVYQDANNCPSGTSRTCAAYGLSCNGTTAVNPVAPVCTDTCSATPQEPPVATIIPADTTGWPSGANCRYVAGGGQCAPAQFAAGACDPGDNQMCFCRNEITTIDGYRYGRAVADGFTETRCGATCADKPQGGTFVAAGCNNPYQCPVNAQPTPTPPPAPVCTTACVNNENVTTCGDQVVRRVPQQCDTTPSCKEDARCEGPDFVVRDCNNNEVSRQNNFPACQPPIAACSSLTFTASGTGDSATTNLASTSVGVYPRIPAAGETLNFSTTGVTGGSTNLTYELWIRPLNADAANACSYYTFAGVSAAASTWVMPANGTNRSVSASTFRQFQSTYPAYTECASTALDFSQGFYVGSNWINNDGAWCANPGPGINNGIIVNGGTISGQSCVNSCLIQATTAPVTTVTTASIQCTNLSVTNTRTGETCSGSNPTCTAFRNNLRQGDTLNATLTGTSGVTGYSLTATPAYTGQATTPQASGTFSNIAIPADKSNSFALRGSVTNGSSTDAAGACSLSFTFATNVTVDKVIDSAASVGLGAGNVVTSSSIVEYDVTISNNGQNILQNVIAVDRLTAYDPSTGNAVTPPFGDIVRATNLTRGGGSSSTPNPVAPRIGKNASNADVTPDNAQLPNDNFTTVQGVKSVEWTRITAFYPGENYTGSVRADIGSFTGTPSLVNTVCLYNDVDNSGTYTTGDTQIDCDEVQVVTEQPEFTVEKTASDESLNVGDSFTYTIKFTNTGDTALDLGNVTVTDTLDSTRINGLTVANISAGGTRSGSTITWTGANLTTANGGSSSLDPNGVVTLTFQVTVLDAYFTSVSECTGSMVNNVKAVSTSPNYTYIAPTITVIVNRQCGEGFTVTKSANPTTFTPGQTITYSATVSNKGDTAAPVVRITDDFATGFTYQPGTTKFTKPDGTSFSLDPTISNGVATWNFPADQQVTLNPGQSMSFTYKMTATNATTGQYPNTICVEEPNGGCDSAVVLPRTGIITTGIAIIGIGLVAAGVHMYRKRKTEQRSKVA